MPGQSGPGSNGNEGVLRIPQNPSITETSPSDCLVSYRWCGVLTLYRGAVSIFYNPSRLGKYSLGESYLSAENQSTEPEHFFYKGIMGLIVEVPMV